MTISDLLTLIGILVAIFAFISERSREYIILKLPRTAIWVIAILFLFIHFLLSYGWWREKFAFFASFEREGFPPPEAWAYVIALLILLYSVYQIFYGPFPLSRRGSLLKYYRTLLLKNDAAFLAQLVEKYHLRDVINYLDKKKAIEVSDDIGVGAIYQEEYWKMYDNAIKGRRLIYGAVIYNNIVIDDIFLDNVANINPYLFSEVIRHLEKIEVKQDDFVNRFLKILMTEKNGHFFREIRGNQNLGDHNTYLIEPERPILYSLFKDIRVCSINQAWRGVGEPAILEMQEESKREYSVLREPDREQDNDTLWSFRITIAIWYFDIMVRQAIEQDIGDHMWMFYYQHFLSAILSNMPELPFPDSDLNKHSRNFDLVEDIFSKMMDWKKVIVEIKKNKLSRSVIDCIGQCIYELATTDSLRAEDKHYLINWVWEDLINTWSPGDEGAVIAEQIIDEGFRMFRRPSESFSPNPEYRGLKEEKYITLLNLLWMDRDTPKLNGVMGQRAARFKTEVVDVLIPI